ncbi:MAG: methionyl-tRNA formyltransferase [Patescibacteria group bacterium]|jgi:methionyl-tRNA formyltransferase
MSHKILFLGTSDFAVPSLRALATDSRFSITAVITQPDRPVGRHATITPPAIKVAAQELGLPVLQPEKIKELQNDPTFQSLVSDRPDVFVVVSYGKILPQWFLDIPKHGCVNVHGSILPRHRGASPIHGAIASGDTKSGVSIMKLDAEMDHGPILAIAEEPILDTDTAGSLHDRLAELGAKLLPDTLADYLEEKIQPVEQDHSKATYCKILTRDDGKLDPTTKTAEELARLVRAFYPWPGTWIELDEKRVKILDVRVASEKIPDALYLDCADGTILELLTVQPEGKKGMSSLDYIRGNKA